MAAATAGADAKLHLLLLILPIHQNHLILHHRGRNRYAAAFGVDITIAPKIFLQNDAPTINPAAAFTEAKCSANLAHFLGLLVDHLCPSVVATGVPTTVRTTMVAATQLP